MHAYLGEVLLIARVGHLGLDGTLVEVLLEGEENLVGIDGLDEVVGYLGTDGLIHYILLFTFGHHDDGDGGVDFLDA